MIRAFNVILVLTVIALSVGLYDIKYRAQLADRHLASLERAIAEEQEGIRILRAEWSYLNQPQRLQLLAQRYTGLETMKAAQIGSFRDIPMPRNPDEFYAPLGRKPLGGYAGVADALGAEGSVIQ